MKRPSYHKHGPIKNDWKIHFPKLDEFNNKLPFCGNSAGFKRNYYFTDNWREVTCNKCKELKYNW